MKSETFQRAFLLTLVIVVSIVFLWMIKAFLVTILFAGLFSSLFRPLYLRLTGYFKGKHALASGLTILIFVLIIVLPLFTFLGLVGNEAVKVTEAVTPWVQEKLQNKAELNEQLQKIPGFSYLTPYSEQILNKIGQAVSGLGNFIFKGATALTAGTVVFLVDFVIMLYAMFFFFIDGPAILEKILYYIPLKSHDERKLVQGFRSMARATIKGLVIIGAAQGTLAGIALWAAGVPSALFWGTVMSVLSMIPNVGSALVWVPACIYLFIKGQTTAGVLVFLWCAVVVGSADNVLRPILVGKDTQMHELMILLSTLGGLGFFGLEGFILGPVMALLFLSLWDIYGHTFKDVLPKPGEL